MDMKFRKGIKMVANPYPCTLSANRQRFTPMVCLLPHCKRARTHAPRLAHASHLFVRPRLEQQPRGHELLRAHGVHKGRMVHLHGAPGARR